MAMRELFCQPLFPLKELSFEYSQYGVLGTRFDDKINDVGRKAASLRMPGRRAPW
jgi:hypothetical protein